MIGNEKYIYSNEILAGINKRQLKHKQGYKPDEIMNPYNDWQNTPANKSFVDHLKICAKNVERLKRIKMEIANGILLITTFAKILKKWTKRANSLPYLSLVWDF